MRTITLEQARRFLLLKNGLIGPRRFQGKKGILAYVRQAGCVQYDPLDVCGRNAELVFLSRIAGFEKSMLNSLLYEERKLLDYWDKNMSIVPIEEWPYMARFRAYFQQAKLSSEDLETHLEEYRAILHERGSVSASDLKSKASVDWYWNPSSLARVVLETMYYRGEVIIHHRQGAIKYYGLTSDWLPQSIVQTMDPIVDDFDYLKRRVLRRIGAIGLLWNRASSAFLMVSGWYDGIAQEKRVQCFADLLRSGLITSVQVADLADPFYYCTDDEPWMQLALSNQVFRTRTEVIAPLDALLWDRKLINELFGFEYTWEVYTPLAKRHYGYYVLPLLSGTRFVGRVEVVLDKLRDVLVMQHLWLESGCPWNAVLQRRVGECLQRLAEFNGCSNYEIAVDAIQISKPKTTEE